MSRSVTPLLHGIGTCRSRSPDLSAPGPTLALPATTPDERKEGRDALHAHRRLAARHDPALPQRRGAAALFGRPARAVAALGALAAEAGAEFVVVAGDVFEHNQLDPRVVSQSLEAMRAIGIPVYLLPGNHDPLDASSVYTSALFIAECPANVHRARSGGRARGAARSADRRRARGGRSARPPIWSPTCWTVCPPTAPPGSSSPTAASTSSTPTRQAVADPAGRASGGAAPRRGALRGVGGQALSHPGRRQRPGLVLRFAGGHQLRPHRVRPGHVLVVDIDEDDPRGRCTVDARRVGRWRFITLRRAGGQQPRHRRSRHEPGPDGGQGPHGRAVGADRHADRDGPGGAGRLPGQVLPVVRLDRVVGQAQRYRRRAGRR